MSNTQDEAIVVSITEKGQATIPKQFRDKHGIETPSKLTVRENDAGEIVIEPLEALTEMRGAANENAEGS